MRLPLLSALAALSLLALPMAHAKDPVPKSNSAPSKGGTCTLTVKKGDLVAQGKPLVVSGSQESHDALVIDGDVVVRSGSKVHDVVALRGKVTVESGAWVSGDVSALGGDVHLHTGAHVLGDASALGGQLRIDEGATLAGDKNQLSVHINGEDLFRNLLGHLITGEGTRQCELRFTED